jgi:RHS repeat-associated protein
MKKGTEALTSLTYTLSNDGLVEATSQKGLPGEESAAYTYDANRRLTGGGTTAYEYDAANNPTKIRSSTETYNAADELESATGITYSYNEVGERTKTTPSSGTATSYGYDQAGNLTSVEKSREGETPAIEDKYTYNGDGLRISNTAGATTAYIAWDFAEKLPLILNDGANSYIYGPEGVPFAQINSEEKAQYLHHDQQSSTRLITSSTGTKEASFTYDAYGNQTGHAGTATTPLGYDGQYTNTDTGLIYLRARDYDPATGQFMSVDPEVEATQEVYDYARDNPLMNGDPTGLTPWSPKVKQAVAKCRGWKNWHSKKSPFYGNQVEYRACQNLLHLPSEVYGTEGKNSILSHFVAAAQDLIAVGINGAKAGFLEGCSLGAASGTELGPPGMVGLCLVSGGAGAVLVGTATGAAGAAVGGLTGERIPVEVLS